jgi:hypothetical protein
METNVWAALSPDEQTKWTERERKNTYSQTSRLETPEELQLHHNHEKFLFLNVLSLFAQCKMNYWWFVTWLDLTSKKSTTVTSVEGLKQKAFKEAGRWITVINFVRNGNATHLFERIGDWNDEGGWTDLLVSTKLCSEICSSIRGPSALNNGCQLYHVFLL